MMGKLRRLFYRAIQFVAIALLVYGFAQTLPLDLALLFAGDTLLYLEAATAVWLTAQATRLRSAFTYSRLILRRSVRRGRFRARRAMRRLAALLPNPGDENRPRPAFAWPGAAAGFPRIASAAF
jgi:hypothetical protein